MGGPGSGPRKGGGVKGLKAIPHESDLYGRSKASKAMTKNVTRKNSTQAVMIPTTYKKHSIERPALMTMQKGKYGMELKRAASKGALNRLSPNNRMFVSKASFRYSSAKMQKNVFAPMAKKQARAVKTSIRKIGRIPLYD